MQGGGKHKEEGNRYFLHTLHVLGTVLSSFTPDPIHPASFGILYPFYKWGNGGLGRLPNRPTLTEPVNGRARTGSQSF